MLRLRALNFYHIKMEGVIISLAILIFLSHLFSVMFVKTRIPEVLPLLILGIILGPLFHLVSPADFGMVDQVFTRVLLIVILFESGLGIKISQIRSTWEQSFRLTVISFIVMLCVVALLSKILLGLHFAYAVILGAILADNSFAIIIPLISKLNISNRVKTVLLTESTIGGVISIVVTITLLNMVKINSFDASLIIAKILYTFVVSFLTGSAAAIFWTTILSKIRKLENGIFLTLAFVLVVYSVCETLGSDGAIGAFIFGIVAGNIRTIRKLHGFKFIERFTMNVKSKAFNDTEKSFFGEVVFILRTFFFVYIGISMQIHSVFSILCGLLFTVVIFLARIPTVNYVMEKQISRIDCAVTSIMVPKGLVTAVLASMIMQSGLAGGAVLQNTIYCVILFSIIFATVFSFLIEKGHTAKLTDFLFKRHGDFSVAVLQESTKGKAAAKSK